VEYYSLLVIPLAFLVHCILKRQKAALLKLSFVVVLLLIVYINIAMTYSFEFNTWCGPEWNYQKYSEMLKHLFYVP